MKKLLVFFSSIVDQNICKTEHIQKNQDLILENPIQKIEKIEKLPLIGSNDVLGVIFSFLDLKTLLNISLSSKDLYQIIQKIQYEYVYINGEKVKLFKYANHYFIDLPNASKNVFIYEKPRRNPWASQDSTMKTVFFKIRFNPKTMMVHNGDFTFAKTTGKITHHSDQIGVPFGTCFGCEGPGVNDGKGIINLKGTKFFIDSEFIHDGCSSNGTWKFKENNQIVELTGGGYCGWTCPKACKSEEEAYKGGWFIKLEFNNFNK